MAINDREITSLSDVHDSAMDCAEELTHISRYFSTFEELDLVPRDAYAIGKVRMAIRLAQDAMEAAQAQIGRMSTETFNLKG